MRLVSASLASIGLALSSAFAGLESANSMTAPAQVKMRMSVPCWRELMSKSDRDNPLSTLQLAQQQICS